MVRTLVAACLVLLVAVPALAQSQEDYPKIQTSLGYANLGLTNLRNQSSRHSGFVNETGFNLTRTLGLENYMGIYGLGDNITLISDFFGGKATYRHYSRFAPYALAGLGVGYFTESSSGGSLSTFAVRFGGGFDVPISDSIAWRVEVSRMRFSSGPPSFNSSTAGTNIAAGIVFTLAQ